MSILRTSLAAFAVVSASFLACTVTTEGTTTPTTDGGTDSSTTIDSGTDTGNSTADSGTDGATAALDCPFASLEAADLTSLQQLGAAGMADVTPGSCSSTEIDALVAAYADQNSDWTSIAASVTGACKTCLVGTSPDGVIHPFTVVSADEGYDDSGASCISKKSGQAKCGSQAIAQDECAGVACTCDGTDEDTYYACIDGVYSDSSTGACSSVRSAYKSACNVTDAASESALIDTCYIKAASPTTAQAIAFEKSVLNYLCGTGTAPVQP